MNICRAARHSGHIYIRPLDSTGDLRKILPVSRTIIGEHHDMWSDNQAWRSIQNTPKRVKTRIYPPLPRTVHPSQSALTTKCKFMSRLQTSHAHAIQKKVPILILFVSRFWGLFLSPNAPVSTALIELCGFRLSSNAFDFWAAILDCGQGRLSSMRLKVGVCSALEFGAN